MIGSWKLPATLLAGAIGAVAFLCPACGGGGAEDTSAAISEPATSRTAASVSAAIETVEFDVAGMTCGGCATATEFALKRLDGVVSAEASYDEATSAGNAVVEYDPAKVSPQRMIDAIEQIGFHPMVRSSGGGGR